LQASIDAMQQPRHHTGRPTTWANLLDCPQLTLFLDHGDLAAPVPAETGRRRDLAGPFLG
jgi:hypothetical protein